MIMRKEQMKALNRYMRESFEKRALAHVQRHFPRNCAELGDTALRATIHDAVERAAAYEIRRECDVLRFIDVMIVYGSDFDRKRPWAAEILNGPVDGKWKTERLFAEARKRFRREGRSV